MSSGLLNHTITVFLAFFAIMNPIANTPLFISLTEGDEAGIRKQIAFKSVLTAFVIVSLFCLCGHLLLQLFGISMPAFRIAGGALVILVGFRMLHGKPSRLHQPSAEDAESVHEAELSVAISPLAIPILAGPGTLATAINFSASGSMVETGITIAMFALLCVITWAFFLFSQRLIRFIGKGGINVITRLMGLILAVIGTQMMLAGIHGAHLQGVF